MMMIHGRFTRKSSGCLLILLLVLQNDHPMTNNQKGPLLLRIAINYIHRCMVYLRYKYLCLPIEPVGTSSVVRIVGRCPTAVKKTLAEE